MPNVPSPTALTLLISSDEKWHVPWHLYIASGVSHLLTRGGNWEGGTHAWVDGTDLVVAAGATVIPSALAVDDARGRAGRAALQLRRLKADRLGRVVRDEAGDERRRKEDN